MNVWILLALFAGSLIPLQAGVNSTLRQPLGSSMLAALVSFVAGTLTLLLCCLVTRTPVPDATALQSVRPWAWCVGGMCGALFVTSNVLITPRLGIGTTLVLTIAAQLIVSIVFDHFGAFGNPISPISSQRMLGAALLIAGAVLIKR